MEIFTGSAESAQFERFLKVLHGLRPVLGFRRFQTVTPQFLDSVIDLTLLLQSLETLQEYVCFGTSHPAERLSKSVEGIFIIGTSSHRDLQMVNGFVRFPKNDQIPAQQELRIGVAGV